MSRKKKSPSRRPGPAPRRAAHELTASPEVDVLVPEFLIWSGNGGPDARKALAYFVKPVLEAHRLLDPTSGGTSFSALTIEASICLCVDAYLGGNDYFYMPYVNALSVYTTFLEQTERWTGTDEQLQELRLFYKRAHVGFAAFGPARGLEKV